MMVSAQSDLNFSGFRMIEDSWFKNVFNENQTDVLGSPYLDEKFTVARIGENPDQILMRYNTYHDNIEFIKDGTIMVLPKIEQYNSVKFLLTDLKIDLFNDTYYINLYTGKNLILYKKVKTKFQKFVKAANGYVDDKPAKFVNVDEEFYLLKENKLVEFPKNKKNILALFPTKTEYLNKYFKENALKLKTEEDLIEVTQILDY